MGTIAEALNLQKEIKATHSSCADTIKKTLDNLLVIKDWIDMGATGYSSIKQDIQQQITLLAVSSLRIEESLVSIEADLDTMDFLLNNAQVAEMTRPYAQDNDNEEVSTILLKTETNGKDNGFDLIITILGLDETGLVPKLIIKSLGEESEMSARVTEASVMLGSLVPIDDSGLRKETSIIPPRR